MKTVCYIVLLNLLCISLHGEMAGKEFFYTCKSCGKGFVGYVVEGKPSIEQYDSDMCYVSFGLNKYSFSVITCPYCGYSFLPSHYFSTRLSENLKELIKENLTPEMEEMRQGIENSRSKGFRNKRYDLQKNIPSILKYNNAIKCYRWLGYPHSFLSKLALNGSWAYRVEVCMPFQISSKAFKKAMGRIDRIMEKYSKELSKLEESNSRKKNERLRIILEYLLSEKKLGVLEKYIMHNMLIGICDRLGRFADTQKYLILAGNNTGRNPRLEIYLRKKRQWLETERYFQKLSIAEKIKGFKSYNYPRVELFKEVYLLGDIYKRTGNLDAGRFWFSQLLHMSDCPGFFKEKAREEMEEISGIDYTSKTVTKVSKNDIMLAQEISNGLGTIDYYINKGFAKKDLDPALCEKVIKKIGYALIIFKDNNGYYPYSFQELWDKKLINPGVVNFISCPVTGEKYLYSPPKTGYLVWPLICDPQAHQWKGKKERYGIFQSNGLPAIKEQIPEEMQ